MPGRVPVVSRVVITAAVAAGVGLVGCSTGTRPGAGLPTSVGAATTTTSGAPRAVVSSSTAPTTPAAGARSYWVGRDRRTEVIVPTVGTAPRPLLLVLHGYGGRASDVLGRAEIERVAATAGVVVAFPEGTRDDRGNRFWNATRACCNFYASDVDDVAHLLGVVDEIVATTPIDPARVAVYGHSNGHFMAYRLACTHAERFRIVVGLAGAMDADPAACRPSRSVGVVHIHGTADQVVRFDGGRLAGPYPGATDSVETWAVRNGCAPSPPVPAPERLDLTDDVDGDDTARLQWSCPAGSPVELWRMDGADHSPSFTDTFAGAVVGVAAGVGPLRR